MKRRFTGIYLIAFIVSVLIKWAVLYYYEVVSSDKLLQATAAVSIANGNGYAFPIVRLDNPDSSQNRPVIEWPPLYSFMLAPVLRATGFDIEQSCLILDLFAGFLLMLFFFLLMQKLQLPPPLVILLLLHRAFDMNKDVLATYGTDALATAMWLAAFYFLLQYLERKKTASLLVVSFCNSCTFLLRYVYLPITFIIPLLLIWNGAKNKNRQYVRAGIISGSFAIVAICVSAIRNYVAAEVAFFSIDADVGFFVENLKNAVPIFWLPFLNIDFFAMQVSLRTFFSFAGVYILLQLSSVVILMLLLVRYVRKWVEWKFIAPPGGQDRFAYYAGSVSVCIVLFLVFLSIFTRPALAHLQEMNWSYLVEARYFQVPGIFIFLELVRWAFKKTEKQIVRVVVRFSVIILCVMQIAHGSWILFKYRNAEKRDYSPYVASKERTANYLRLLSGDAKSKGTDLIVITDKYGILGEAINHNIKVTNPVSQLNEDIHLQLKQTLMMLAIDEMSANYYKPLIEKYGFRLDTVVERNAFFRKLD